MKKLIVCAVLAVLTWVPCAHPATYYVRPDGDDGASGLSDAAAWKPLQGSMIRLRPTAIYSSSSGVDVGQPVPRMKQSEPGSIGARVKP